MGPPSAPIDPDDALQTLDGELARGRSLLSDATTAEALGAAEVSVLGRKSPLATVQRGLGGLSDEDRRRVGQRTNEVREELRVAVAGRRAALDAEREARLLEGDRIDVTLPGRRLRRGSLHPLTVTQYEIVDIFTRMGYQAVEGPEVETDWYNFDALNIPPDHPARTLM